MKLALIVLTTIFSLVLGAWKLDQEYSLDTFEYNGHVISYSPQLVSIETAGSSYVHPLLVTSADGRYQVRVSFVGNQTTSVTNPDSGSYFELANNLGRRLECVYENSLGKECWRDMVAKEADGSFSRKAYRLLGYSNASVAFRRLYLNYSEDLTLDERLFISSGISMMFTASKESISLQDVMASAEINPAGLVDSFYMLNRESFSAPEAKTFNWRSSSETQEVAGYCSTYGRELCLDGSCASQQANPAYVDPSTFFHLLSFHNSGENAGAGGFNFVDGWYNDEMACRYSGEAKIQGSTGQQTVTLCCGNFRPDSYLSSDVRLN